MFGVNLHLGYPADESGRTEKKLNNGNHGEGGKRPRRYKFTQSVSNDHSNRRIGRTVELLWSEKDVEGTSWKPGWCRGEVQDYSEENDILNGQILLQRPYCIQL